MRVAIGASLTLASAGCNLGSSDNVMAPQANMLTPQQVDLALGPELTNSAGNQLNSVNGVNAVDPANAVEAADTEDVLDESAADETTPANNSSEQ